VPTATTAAWPLEVVPQQKVLVDDTRRLRKTIIIIIIIILFKSGNMAQNTKADRQTTHTYTHEEELSRYTDIPRYFVSL